MNFAGVLDRVDALLMAGDWRWAVVGGVALAACGHPRLTLDLDIVTESGAQDTLVPVRVPRPEHLIAMKVQAMKNAPERTWQEMADIGYLLTLAGIDHREAREYFVKANLLERWEELARGL